MKSTSKLTQALVRQAFGLILDLRARDNAQVLLAQAVAFMELLDKEKNPDAHPTAVLSLRVMQVGRS